MHGDTSPAEGDTCNMDIEYTQIDYDIKKVYACYYCYTSTYLYMIYNGVQTGIVNSIIL